MPDPGTVDHARLELRGNGHTQDSFALAVQAAARLLGREADYLEVVALSSNCFAAAINLEEECTAWWHVEGYLGDRAMATVAAALGLRAERLPLERGTGPDEPAAVAAFQRRRAATIHTALERGGVVLTAGGWQVRTEQGFAPWGWWGIITEAREDGSLFGACLAADPGRQQGYVDRPMANAWDCWELHAGKPTLTGREALGEALANAIARIRGEGRFASSAEWRYGLAAMDSWIAAMGQTPFCFPCSKSAPDRVWSCALDNGRTTTAASQAAAAWLRRIAEESPAPEPLVAAAAHYDRIVALLAPAMDWNGEGHYRHFIGDLARQQAHAAVLRQVKDELAAAGEQMRGALGALGG